MGDNKTRVVMFEGHWVVGKVYGEMGIISGEPLVDKVLVIRATTRLNIVVVSYASTGYGWWAGIRRDDGEINNEEDGIDVEES